MSIINEALKKARREAGARENVSSPAEETVIQPRTRVTAKSSPWMILPVLLLILAFLGLIGGLGYYAYTQFFAQPAEDGLKIEFAEKAPAPPAEAPSPPDPDPEPEPQTAVSSSVNLKPSSASQPVAPESVPTAPSSAPASPIAAPPELLEEFEINGVMRGGSSVRVITNSGVYRTGDLISSPQGYKLEKIGDQHLTLRSPDGILYAVPLP